MGRDTVVGWILYHIRRRAQFRKCDIHYNCTFYAAHTSSLLSSLASGGDRPCSSTAAVSSALSEAPSG